MRRLGAFALVAMIAASLAGCATATTEPTRPPSLAEVAFQSANQDARTQSSANVYDRLLAITDGNPKLVWKDPASKRFIKVASLMSRSSYDRYYKGVSGGTTSGAYNWVTLVPQLQDFCRSTGLTGSPLADRVTQYLGLSPERHYAVVVEFWVDRSDLFRPCPDPDTADTSCDLSFAMVGGQPVDPPVKGLTSYLDWFNATYQGSYVEGGAPWTRLGYTYDWNPATPKFGASEYLITKGAVFEVVGDGRALETYCAN